MATMNNIISELRSYVNGKDQDSYGVELVQRAIAELEAKDRHRQHWIDTWRGNAETLRERANQLESCGYSEGKIRLEDRAKFNEARADDLTL